MLKESESMEITRKRAKIERKIEMIKKKVGYFYLSNKVGKPLAGPIKETKGKAENKEQPQVY